MHFKIKTKKTFSAWKSVYRRKNPRTIKKTMVRKLFNIIEEAELLEFLYVVAHKSIRSTDKVYMSMSPFYNVLSTLRTFLIFLYLNSIFFNLNTIKILDL